MDYSNSSRRQYVQDPYSTQQPAQTNVPVSDSYSSTPAEAHFRHSSFIQTSPTCAAPSGRASNDHAYDFAQSSPYGPGTLSTAQPLQYPGDLPTTPDMSRRQDTQQYAPYGAAILYGLAQQAQSAIPSSYDPASQYTQRHASTSETLASQFSGAQSAQYYLAGQSLPTSAALPDFAASQLSAQYQTAYAQVGPSSQAYAGTVMDPTQSRASSTYAQQYAQPGSGQDADQHLRNCESQIRTIFFHVREGSLRDAASILMVVSNDLLSHVEILGLTRDYDALRDDRVRMWDEFNRAWLVTLQTQFDMAQEYLHTRQFSQSTALLDQQTLETLSSELVRLCDRIEKYGLVDYQTGVAEEEIMDLLLRCMNQREEESAPSAVDVGTVPSSSGP